MLKLLYHDRWLAVCIKPHGILSEEVGDKGMPQLLRDTLGLATMPLCVHRLDREAAGVMVYALDGKMAAVLSQQFAQREASKEYLAVAGGVTETDSGEMRDLLFYDRKRGKTFVVDRMRAGVKDALLEYRLLTSQEGLGLYRIALHTGRTHQIRAQFASRGMTLFGDGRYGSHEKGRMALWSYRLAFRHPATGEPMVFWCLPPEEAPWTAYEQVLHELSEN